jgi:hypothetical protein
MLCMLTLMIGGLVTQTANAQWEVVDKDANKTLGKISDNTKDTATNTKQTDTDLNKDLNIGTSAADPGDSTLKRAEDPKQAWQTAALEDGIDQCTKYAQTQQANCQEIVHTQNAQYLYMVTMYKNTDTRNQRLQTILKERQNISGSNLGQLEDNTNKLTALYALMAIDRQQMESVNYAYETRLRYLRNEQTKLANAAATGNPPGSGDGISIPLLGDINVGSLVSTLTTGVALKTALNGVASDTPSNMKTLSVENSNGL